SSASGPSIGTSATSSPSCASPPEPQRRPTHTSTASCEGVGGITHAPTTRRWVLHRMSSGGCAAAIAAMTTHLHDLETVVVGGGQAGLATGYHLARRGRSFVILDAHDRIGDAWRLRWDSLRLFTPARRDGLPGMRFPAAKPSFPTKDEMADYLEAYAE